MLEYGFYLPLYSPIRTSQILSLYWKMSVSENLCPRVFYTMNIISYNMELIDVALES